jgi:hypothetical protein
MELKQIKIGKWLFGLSMLVVLGFCSSAFAKTKDKTKDFKGSGGDTYSYSEYAPGDFGAAFTGIGKDTLGGTFLLAGDGYVSDTGTACTAPDGTAGTVYDNIFAVFVKTYEDGSQLYADDESTSDSECDSDTTGSQGGTYTYAFTGGSAAYSGATGTLTVKFTDDILATSSDTSGFASQYYTISGSVTP